MLPFVETPIHSLERYKGIIPDDLYREIKSLSKDLRGRKIVMINSTPRGGGVAEILANLVPLIKGVGLDAHWHVIPPGKKFFSLTKEIHNALQGKEYTLSFHSRRLYRYHMERAAKLMLDMNSDIWVIHDPQPVGVIHYLPNFHPSISHIHIDTSSPNQDAWRFLEPFLLMYNRIIFSTKDFVAKTLPKKKIVVFPPAINPLTDKNKPLKPNMAKTILKSFRINPAKPLISQISRFDPWKDPSGVIQAYKIAKKEIPNLQLALVGLFLAIDDPEAMRVFKEVQKESKGDPDIFLFSSPQELGSLTVDTFVNAFQAGSDVVLQKSIKEGFGLTICEAMWKGKPVIGGNVGGIKLQIKNGQNGFLVSSPEGAAKRIVQLLKNPTLSQKIGKAAQETVRKNFLMPRLLRDYLKLFRELTLK
jgi:trehalose synthase